MRKIFKDYGLSIVLAILFVGSWIGQGFAQWAEFVSLQQAHNQPATIAGFMPEFWSATFENWQSEFLQLLTFVVLTSFLIHKGSSESKDGDDEMKAALARIEKKLGSQKRK